MKNILSLALLIALYSCGGNSSTSKEDISAESSKLKPDSLTAHWARNFKEFRNAIYHNEPEKVKAFFKFPILNYNNEIWTQAFTEQELKSKNISLEPTVAFTEMDFDLSFKKLFPNEFITSLLKIKSDSLFRTGKFSTGTFEGDSTATYELIATIGDHVEGNKVLELNLHFLGADESAGDYEGAGEYSIIYRFLLGDDGRLLFKEIRLAG